MDDEELIQHLIEAGEAVQYGERWTPTTTHEWWWTNDDHTDRSVRLVQTYHGGGNRGDDDEAEYVRRLRDLGRAVDVPEGALDADDLRARYPDASITHVIQGGKAVRFRYYIAPPEGVSHDGSPE